MTRIRDRRTGLYMELEEPVKATAFTLFERQLEQLTAMANEKGIGRSELLRGIVDNYLETCKEKNDQ